MTTWSGKTRRNWTHWFQFKTRDRRELEGRNREKAKSIQAPFLLWAMTAARKGEPKVFRCLLAHGNKRILVMVQFVVRRFVTKYCFYILLFNVLQKKNLACI